jgi:uncharacterized protein
MNRWQIVRLDAVAATPWRNGGGVTRELLAWPGAADWKIRMSVAEVGEDGPFSAFHGVTRWFAVLDGAGVRLRLDDSLHELTRDSAPFEFDGGVPAGCALIGGATRDFNLMLRGDRGHMARVRGSLVRDCLHPCFVAVYAREPARLGFWGEATALPPRSLAWRMLDAPGEVCIDSDDALWMEIGQ